jgi:DnaJ-class molecular chaperone
MSSGAQNRRDPYQVLGVAHDADEATLKKTYHRLAQKSHPDMNPDDAQAEERFKEIGVAYAVLSDPERRRAYDEFGQIALDPNFDAEQARAATRGFGGAGFARGGFEGPYAGANGPFADLGDVFGSLFGEARNHRPRARRGADLETTLTLDFVDAALGCERRIDLQRSPAGGGPPEKQTLKIRIPCGVADGGRIRLAGQGAPGSAGGPPGDLLARIRVRPHPVFRRDGRDLRMEAAIGVSEAVLGTEFEIPTLDGRVTLRIPPGTDSGSKLRLQGKGIPGSGGRAPGDLYVEIRIRVPKNLDEETKQKFAALADRDPTGLRDDLD